MTLNDFLDNILFTVGEFNITIGNLILVALILFIIFFLYLFISKRYLPKFFRRERVDSIWQKKIIRLTSFIFLLLTLLGIVLGAGLNYELYTYTKASGDTVAINLSMIIQAILVLQFARLIDWLISKVIIQNYYKRRTEQKDPPSPRYGKEEMTKADSTVQYVVYALAILLIIQHFEINDTIFTFSGSDNTYRFTLSNIVTAVLIILSARLVNWILIQIVLFGYYKRKRIDIGAQFAINQLLKYFLYVIAILIALESLGVQLTVLWGGAAALLVGIGLGLQQIFNDFISGILLLFERTVEVGHVVEIDSLIGSVKKIGIRTSLVETRDNITVIVPNSILTSNNVINWSHYDNKARFQVSVGVAYGSDTQLVKKILLEVASENGYVIKYPSPFVRFIEFGDSSLNFELHFWSHEFIQIEDVKSDLRFEIDRLFRKNSIEIPFPQRDIWIRNNPQ